MPGAVQTSLIFQSMMVICYIGDYCIFWSLWTILCFSYVPNLWEEGVNGAQENFWWQPQWLDPRDQWHMLSIDHPCLLLENPSSFLCFRVSQVQPQVPQSVHRRTWVKKLHSVEHTCVLNRQRGVSMAPYSGGLKRIEGMPEHHVAYSDVLPFQPDPTPPWIPFSCLHGDPAFFNWLGAPH